VAQVALPSPEWRTIMSLLSGIAGSSIADVLSQLPSVESSAEKLGGLLSPAVGLLEKLGLNPQPLPPKEAAIGMDKAFGGGAMNLDDWCGTVPKRFPPPPPPPLGPLAELMGSMLGGR
jgi:hypothetical protein